MVAQPKKDTSLRHSYSIEQTRIFSFFSIALGTVRIIRLLDCKGPSIALRSLHTYVIRSFIHSLDLSPSLLSAASPTHFNSHIQDDDSTDKLYLRLGGRCRLDNESFSTTTTLFAAQAVVNNNNVNVNDDTSIDFASLFHIDTSQTRRTRNDNDNKDDNRKAQAQTSL